MKIAKLGVFLLTFGIAGQVQAGITEYQTSRVSFNPYTSRNRNISIFFEGAIVASMGGYIAKIVSGDRKVGAFATGLIALMLCKHYMDMKKQSVYFIPQKDFESKKPEIQAKVQVALHSGVSCLILNEHEQVIKVINNGQDVTHLHAK